MTPTLIPQPRNVVWRHGTTAVGRLEASGDVPAEYRVHIETLLGEMGRDGPVVPVVFTRETGQAAEGYTLEIGADVRITSSDALGALHAVRTLLDLWDAGDGASLQRGEIGDHPTFSTRGLFVESVTGVDLMELSDWRELVDRVAQLKFNTLGVSVYGCWQLGHDSDRTEFMFVPLPDYPELVTPQRIQTWDSGREVELMYVPRMFDDDFFGDVVAYAHERGVEVVPHFGGPGHSTLVPRNVPALSAVGESGEPTGYGYCVSQPAAVEALRALVRAIAEKVLVPHGLRRLHVAGDEYYPIRNIDPDDLRRVVSPYCRCESCRSLTPGRMLERYLLSVGAVLAEYEIGMVHWQDTLVREGVLSDYLDAAADAGLPEPVISWWKYNDPVPVPDASRTTTWVSPTTGIFSHLFCQDFTPNIETALRRGHDAGAVGTLAYSLPQPADHPNMACLADLAWNLEGSGGATGFWRRWALSTVPADPEVALHAWSSWRTVASCYPLMLYVLDHVLPSFATTSGGVTRYPDDLLRAFSLPQPGLAQVLAQVRDTVRDAAAQMPAGRAVRHWADPVHTWTAQCERLAGTLDLFLDMLATARREGPSREELLHRARGLLDQVSEATPPYLRPAVLREHWGLVRGIDRAPDVTVDGPESWFAWIV